MKKFVLAKCKVTHGLNTEDIGIKSNSSIDFNHSHCVNFLIKFRFAEIKGLKLNRFISYINLKRVNITDL